MLAFCHAEAIACLQIFNIVVEPIKVTFSLTDTEYSLMQGAAVGVLAALVGIPAAAIADRGFHKRVILVGAVIWSAATMFCGLATSYGHLFAARVVVGVGEAFLFPAALSLIASSAPPRYLSTAIGFFGCGGPIGAAAALVGGGWIANHHEWVQISVLASNDVAWRVPLLICSAFGAVGVALLLTTSASRSAETSTQSHGPIVSARVARTYLSGALAGVCASMLVLSFCVFATSSWAPTMLVRVYGTGLEVAGKVTGLAALVGGVVGAWAAGFLTDAIEARGHRDAALLVAIAVAALILLTAVGAALSRSAGLAVAFLCGAYSLLGMPTVLAATAIQQVSPPAIRAQVMAAQVVLVNLVSLSLGPLAVAVLTDHVFGHPSSVGYALALTDGSGALLAIGGFLLLRRRFVAQRRRLND